MEDNNEITNLTKENDILKKELEQQKFNYIKLSTELGQGIFECEDLVTQFAMPLMANLNYPTLFCNTLEVAPDGEITGYQMRCAQSKLTTVRALQSCGFDTIAAGDSHNDLAMIRASKAGFLFRSTDAIIAENPDLPAFEEFDEFLAAIKAVL